MLGTVTEQYSDSRSDDFDIDAVMARWDLNTELINAGNQAGALVYGLLDALVDGHAVERAPDLRAGYDGDFGEGVPPCR